MERGKKGKNKTEKRSLMHKNIWMGICAAQPTTYHEAPFPPGLWLHGSQSGGRAGGFGETAQLEKHQCSHCRVRHHRQRGARPRKHRHPHRVQRLPSSL